LRWGLEKMPFALVLIGILMIVTGAQGTYAQFGSQVAKDFTGPGGFLYWIIAIFIIGAIGYSDRFRTISHLFLALVIIAMILSNRGVFAKFTQQLKQGPTAPVAVSRGGGPAVSQAPTQQPVWYDPRTWSLPSLGNVFQGMVNGP
jgi:hypothetical protein